MRQGELRSLPKSARFDQASIIQAGKNRYDQRRQHDGHFRGIAGNEIQGDALHLAIAQKIGTAFLVLADISNDNVNACIEAGMALATGTNVRLIGRRKPRNPPFMLRGAGQLATYAVEVERIGVPHKSLRPFRRRLINLEL